MTERRGYKGFDKMKANALYSFAMNLPSDIESNEKNQLIEALADEMKFWHDAATL